MPLAGEGLEERVLDAAPDNLTRMQRGGQGLERSVLCQDVPRIVGDRRPGVAMRNPAGFDPLLADVARRIRVEDKFTGRNGGLEPKDLELTFISDLEDHVRVI